MSYWKLTPHIVRYNHQSAVESNAMHTVNERMLYLLDWCRNGSYLGRHPGRQLCGDDQVLHYLDSQRG